MRRHLSIFAVLLVFAAFALCGCKSVPAGKIQFSRFGGWANLAAFQRTTNAQGETVLLSPLVPSEMNGNELIVSWNAAAPPGTFVKVEARARLSQHLTRFYVMGNWSPEGKLFPRVSVRGQKDDDGDVDTDTLILNRPADAAQIRITLGSASGAQPELNFLGVSYSNPKSLPLKRSPNRAAWGKSISIPEYSQHGYPNEAGWCSPASLAMVLSHWAKILNRPELNLTVPQAAAAVFDSEFNGTGNWSFNTAFAGSFTGMRAYVTRFDDISEIEDWIAAGIPVVLSARWDWLTPGRPSDPTGHLIVCTGFTQHGDVVVNDPATRPERGEFVRRIYRRADVIHAWSKSHNTVYLVYPTGTKIPATAFGHWANQE
jgi:hypothetical protein